MAQGGAVHIAGGKAGNIGEPVSKCVLLTWQVPEKHRYRKLLAILLHMLHCCVQVPNRRAGAPITKVNNQL